MPTVVIEPKLYSRVEEIASKAKASIDEIMAEAVRLYLWEMGRRKISEESQFYRQRQEELKANYLGQYIAMHNGQVVDHDVDFQTLRQRVRQHFNDMPVMITLVEAAEMVQVRRGFREETNFP